MFLDINFLGAIMSVMLTYIRTFSMVKQPDPTDFLAIEEDSELCRMPAGGLKIIKAMTSLLQEKTFNSVTTAEISRVSGVNEALIYRYFKDKRGLLHKILAAYFRIHLAQIRVDVDEVTGAVGKLRTLIKGTISFHKKNSVFSRILLLEVRNHPTYFESEAYDLAKEYSRLINEIIESGIKRGEIRDDIPLSCMRDIIIGSIERACMRPAIFDRDFDEELLAENLAEAVLGGLQRP
jgi:TetR/AcrR family transcriptional regulator, fatty acid metabolism regulator protein